jgi:peptide/nickel transport system substrate-binding protein
MTRHEGSDSVENLIDEYTAQRIDRRQFFARAGALGLTLSAAGAILAACGGGGSAATTSGTTAGTTPAETTGATGQPVKGGTLLEGYDRDFSPYDTVFTPWADPAFVAIYEYTVARDANGKYVPQLVDTWQVSDDLLTWTFKIRPNLTFQSGAPVTAQVIADNFNVFRDPKQGANAVFWPTVTNATASDPTTVVVTMKAPFTAFPETLATELAMIENLDMRKQLGKKYGATGADGTGPFTLSSYKPGTEVVVNRWDAYPGNNLPFVQNKGPAHLDSIKWVPILEPGQRANEIEGGTVNIVVNPAGQDVPRLQSNSDLVTVNFPALANYFLGPNHQQKKLGFDDVKVRQAISQAIDRKSLADSLFFGQAVPTYGPIAPNFKWYEPGVEQFNQFDPDKAKSLLDSAGWTAGSDGIRQKNGQRLSFTNTSNDQNQPTTAAIDQAIVSMLKDVGVEMKLNVPDASAFFSVVSTAADPAKALDLDAWTYEWLWSSPVDLLIYFQAFPSTAWNGDLPDVATAIKKWQTAPDEATLEQAARDLQLVWAEQLPEIPILTRNNVWVHQKTVMGYTPLQSMLYPFYNDVYIQS